MGVFDEIKGVLKEPWGSVAIIVAPRSRVSAPIRVSQFGLTTNWVTTIRDPIHLIVVRNVEVR